MVYVLDNGTHVPIPGFAPNFTFAVDSTGHVINVSNPVAAQADGNTLTLNNASLVINPGGFTGHYQLSSHLDAAYISLRGPQTIVLVPNMDYFLDSGSHVAIPGFSSNFLFAVDSGGHVVSVGNTIAAQSSGNTLTLNNTSITIDPASYSGQYLLSSYLDAAYTPFSGVQTIVLVPNLVCLLIAGGQSGAFAPGLYQVSPASLTLTIAGQPQTFLFNVVPQAPACSSPSFANAGNFFTGRGPTYVTVADFNNDSKLDLATTNQGTDSVGVLLGDGAGGFTRVGEFPTAHTPNSVEAGDFNNDGKPDLAVPCFFGGSVTVLLGDGAGGFTTVANLSAPRGARFAALRDFNRDGKLDIAVTEQDENVIRLFFGNGTGGFSAPSNFTAGLGPYGLTSADFNGDGKDDLAVTNYRDGTGSILLGDGNGGFAPPTSFLAGYTPYRFTIADLNGDGKLDLVTANELTFRLSVLLGDGAGGFGPKTDVMVGDNPSIVAVADFNGDNKQDLVVQQREAGRISVLLGDGTGNFGGLNNITVGPSPISVVAADFNRDGKPDFGVGNAGASDVQIFLNTCGAADTTPPTIICPSNVAAPNAANQCSANVNTGTATATDNVDGAITPTAVRSDAQSLSAPYPVGATTITWTATDSAGNSATCQQTITINDTQPPTLICPGNFTKYVDSGLSSLVVNYVATASDNCSSVSLTCNPPSGAIFPIGATTVNCAATDSAGNATSRAFTVTVSDTRPQSVCTTPSFGPPAEIAPLQGPVFIAAADFNNDGKVDMVINQGADIVSIFLGNGAGGFTHGGDFTTPSIPNSVEVGDFNNDGKLDLAIPCYSGASCAVMLGDGAGGFTTTAILPVPGNARYAALGDFDRDGNLDLAVTDQGKINVRLFFGDGAGGFSPATILTAGSGPFGITTADFNGDGKLDLVTTNHNGCSVSIQLGDGAGGFAPPTSFPAGCTPVTLAIADFNSDGNLDLVVADELSNGVSVLLGNGSGSFGAPTFYATGDHATIVRVADFNGDHNADIVVQVRFGNPSVAVLLGDGAGSFSTPTYFPVGQGPFGLVAADLNGDGKPDIAVAAPDSQKVFILLNTCNAADTTPPIVTCAANVATSNSPDQCSASVNTGAATATDNIDGSVTPAGTRSDGLALTAPYPVGMTTITWIATDAAGNSAMCQQTVTVNDTQPPAITCPANINRNTDAGLCSAVVTYTATASDNCSGASVACNPQSGSAFQKGTTTVNCTATDTAGNTAACSFTVTVVDNQAPQIICPPNITVSTDAGVCSAVVTYSAPIASDNCSLAAPVCSPPSGSTFPVGTTTVSCTATDSANLTSSCSFTITVNVPQLTALGPAKVWIGLKNSDDVGTKFDLLAEVLRNGSVIGSGQLNDVPGGSSGFNNAILDTINLALSSQANLCAGDTLGLRLSVRIAASSGHRSGTARLWYDDAAATSRFNATISGTPGDLFLANAFSLGTSAGRGPKKTIDVTVDRAAGGNPFKPFGTWTKSF
ncbi:MAG: FG-GAP-like repeat-containing protein [Acidobacteriota bacterium]